MASGSGRNWRGWLYAAFIAIILSTAFWYVERLSRQPGSSIAHLQRTTKHVAGSTSVERNFATEDFPLVFQESLQVDEARVWGRTRSGSTSLAVPSIDPAAVVQLMAPVAIEQPSVPSLAVTSASTENTEPVDPSESSMRVVSAVRSIDERPRTNKNLLGSIPTLSNMEPTDAWPRPAALTAELEKLLSDAQANAAESTADWTIQAQELVQQLTSLASMRDAASLTILESLQKHAEQTLQASMADSNEPEALLRRRYHIAYSILRRSLVWSCACRCLQGNSTTLVAHENKAAIQFQNFREELEQIQSEVSKTGDVQGWSTYLVLDDLYRLAQSTDAPADQAALIARKFLSRVAWQRVNERQHALLSSEPVQRLARKLQPLAYGPVDYRQLLADLEAMEIDPIHRSRYSVAQQVLSLRFASSQVQLELAEAINTFYRNANLRVAVSKDMLQRFLPKSQVVDRPVRQKILGADTRGSSQVQTNLGLELVPDKHAWNIVLNVKGDIQASTKSSRGPATFFNDSVSFIDTKRSIRVDTTGLNITGSGTSVDSHDNLRGFNTDFDSLPVLGDMLRHVVRQQFDSQRPIASRIMKKTIAEQTDSELDKQLSQKVDVAEREFQSKLLTPLERMELNPLVVDLETTEQRLIARYRIAGSEQMAAFTPRPLAPSDSHISIQVHESTINNAIDKVQLSGREWTLEELSHQLADVLQQPHWEIPADVPRDVHLQFANTRPLTVEFADGKMQLTLRIAALRQEGTIHLKNFIIRTEYAPQATGMVAQLNRQGAISVDGQRLGIRERMQLRTIFARIFAARPSLPLLSPELVDDERVNGLAVSQLEIRDGWMAMAVSNAESPHVALLQNSDRSIH